MKEIAMRFSGGKDSTLSALRVAQEFDRVHLLTFRQEMMQNVERSKENVPKLQEMCEGKTTFIHKIIDFGQLVSRIFYGKGYFHDLLRYGTLARVPICTACDFSMTVRTVKYCVDNGITSACDGGNKTEFAGYLDDWGLPIIKDFARSHNVNWMFPVFDEPRCDITLLKLGLKGKNPTIFFRNQARCRGGGLFANIHLRCYYLPLHGRKKYEEVTERWLNERKQIANEYISSGLI